MSETTQGPPLFPCYLQSFLTPHLFHRHSLRTGPKPRAANRGRSAPSAKSVTGGQQTLGTYLTTYVDENQILQCTVSVTT
jgi:hypothetical protein